MAQRVVIPGFRKIETSGGGEGGTGNYNDLTNKPSINNIPLVGNINTADLKLTDATLTEEGVPAESKTVGAKLEEQSTSLTALSEQLGSHTVKSNVPENAVFTDTVYDDTEVKESISAQSTEIMDIKMLGWSVPKECPVQNEVNGNQFVQKVGRVDLGTLDWVYDAVPRFYTNRLQTFVNPVKSETDIFLGYLKGYTNLSLHDLFYGTKDKAIAESTNGTVSIKDTSYTDTTAFKIAMQGQYLYYELATPITITIDGYEIGETVSDVRKETTVNLFKPTLETTTKNGVTCTNNGDGTYTLDGTSTTTVEFDLGSITLLPGTYKNIGCKAYLRPDDTNVSVLQYDEVFTISQKSTIIPFVYYNIGETATHPFRKPMITTNLNATIDDFVPYTGDSGSLNGDVADLRGDVDGFGDEFVTKRIQLLNNRTADYYRYIEPVAGENQILTPPIIVNGTATSFDSSGGDEVSGANYSYAPRESVKMDILDVEVSSSVTQEGITVKFLDKRLDLSKLYNVTGKATSDIEIPLYSVTNPKNDYLYFITDSVSKMSSDTFYIKISDSSGNETTLGTDGSKSLKTYLKKHNGKVTVYLVVKSGITVKQYVNVKCGYSSSDCIADFSPRKYSDTIDNVLDAIFDLNSRLKALENK